MDNWTRFALLALCLATSATAQSAKPSTSKSSKPAAKAPAKTSGREKFDPGASHEALVMAYRDNIANFARVLRGRGSPYEPVSVEVARPAIAEMRRSYEQLMRHYKAEMESMDGPMTPTTKAAQSRMDGHLGALEQQLSALDLVVNDPAPDPKEVASRSAEVLKHCAALSATRVKLVR